MADTFHLGYMEAVLELERARQSIMQQLGQELDRSEFSRLTPAQAMMLFRIDKRKMTFTEVQQSCQVGTNVSHNLNNLVGWGFLTREPSSMDRRVVYIRLTPLGEEARKFVENSLRAQSAVTEQFSGITPTALTGLVTALKQINRVTGGIIG